MKVKENLHLNLNNKLAQNQLFLQSIKSSLNFNDSSNIINDIISKPIPYVPVIFDSSNQQFETNIKLEKNFQHDGLLTFVNNNDWRRFNITDYLFVESLPKFGENNNNLNKIEQSITNIKKNETIFKNKKRAVIQINRRTSAPACLLSKKLTPAQCLINSASAALVILKILQFFFIY